MPSAVLDSTVLVSAFLKPVPGGVSFDLLRFAERGSFDLVLSEDILEETARVLLTSERNRRRYKYPDDAVTQYCHNLERFAAVVISDPPELTVVRDPNDDMIVACAVEAAADFIISRDHDLRVLGTYEGIQILTPEAFLHVLRSA